MSMFSPNHHIPLRSAFDFAEECAPLGSMDCEYDFFYFNPHSVLRRKFFLGYYRTPVADSIIPETGIKRNESCPVPLFTVIKSKVRLDLTEEEIEKLSRTEKKQFYRLKKKAKRLLQQRIDRCWKRVIKASNELARLQQEEHLSPADIEQLEQELINAINEGNFNVNLIPKFLVWKIEQIAEEMKSTEDLRAKYFTNPKSDFTRERDIDLKDLLTLLITMAGDCINKEIYEYFKYTPSHPSAPALIYARSKLKAEGVEYFFKRMTEVCQTIASQIKDPEVAKKHFADLLAVDGSDINVFLDPNADTHVKGKKGTKGYNQYHLNTIYSIYNNMFMNAVLQPKQFVHETRAAASMIREMKFASKTLLTADRGYGSLNLLETVRRVENLECLFRVKEDWITEIKALPLAELDTIITIHVITTARKCDKERCKAGKAKYMSGESKFGKYKKSQTWDYESEVDVVFRVVRFQLSSGNWETLVTTLIDDVYSLEDFKELYHERWQIELGYRYLKWSTHLAQMHSKLDNSNRQEIYARLCMHNIVSCILKHAAERDLMPEIVVKGEVKERKHTLILNRHFATHVICDFLKNSHVISFDIIEEICRHKSPVRKGRSFKRDMRAIGFYSFLYRA